jgi:hypothetical protein
LISDHNLPTTIFLQESLVMAPGVLPVDGLSINIEEMKRQAVAAANELNQPYNSITARQQTMIPASAAGATNTAANVGAPQVNSKKQALENLIKLGIAINTIDVRDHYLATCTPLLFHCH